MIIALGLWVDAIFIFDWLVPLQAQAAVELKSAEQNLSEDGKAKAVEEKADKPEENAQALKQMEIR